MSICRVGAGAVECEVDDSGVQGGGGHKNKGQTAKEEEKQKLRGILAEGELFF